MIAFGTRLSEAVVISVQHSRFFGLYSPGRIQCYEDTASKDGAAISGAAKVRTRVLF